jgi:2-dehydro-3-deoxyphosphooctonate aldolase (KDO 8-P synthase)
MKTITIAPPAPCKSVHIGPGNPLTLIAGPCVIESKEICFKIAETMCNTCETLGIQYIFKASFDKANRTSIDSHRGPGLNVGLELLAEVKAHFNVPVITDIHLPEQAAPTAQICDILQIPALLSRQTDLIAAAAQTGKTVQIKKGQFMAPWDMKNVIDKIEHFDNHNIITVERGSSFGYNRLICDMNSIGEMQSLGYPAIMDATHATQSPSSLGNASGGSPELAKKLALAALAVGANGLFIETHPNPKSALSDGACMIPLNDMPSLLQKCIEIYRIANSA